METSAKTGYNARNVLIEAAKLLYQDYLKLEQNEDNNNKIDKDKDKNKKLIKKDKKEKKGCC